MRSILLKYGAGTGILIAAYTLGFVLFMGDFDEIKPEELATAQTLGYLRYILLALGVILAMRAFTRRTNAAIPYSRVLKVGVMVALVVACFVGAMEYSYMAFINPNFIDQYMSLTVERSRQEGKSEAEIAEEQKRMKFFEFMRHPPAVGAFYFAETLVEGTLLAAFAAIFLRRKQPLDDTDGLAEAT